MHGTHIYQTVSREQRAARERIQRSHACRAITDRPQEISNREQRAPMTANDDRGHGRSRRRAATNSYNLTVIRRSRTASGRPCARGAYTSTIASTDDPGDERRRMLGNSGDREPICCSSAFSPPLTERHLEKRCRRWQVKMLANRCVALSDSPFLINIS